MKKLISLALAVLMILSMATVAFADGENTQKGSITITGIALKDNSTDPIANYTLYKLLDIESIKQTTDPNTNITTTSLSYVANNPVWEQFFIDSQSFNVERKVVTLTSTADQTSIAKATAAAAIDLINERKADEDPSNDISPVNATFTVTKTADGIGNLTFDNLDLGYYLIASDMGILCGIDSTTPHGQINAKNSPPTITKQVQEDTNSTWGDTNHADIGQSVNFRSVIIAQAGAANYVAHDIMSDGLTFEPGSVKIYILNKTNGYEPKTSNELDDSNYTVHVNGKCTPCGGEDCEVIEDQCTFEIHFKSTFLNGLQTNDQIYITYSATLNHDAKIGQSEGNSNQAFVSYGNDFSTETDETTTYTYRFDIAKVDGVTKQLLDGAEFYLSKTNDMFYEDGTIKMDNVIQLADMGSVNGVRTYHLFHDNVSDKNSKTDTIVAKDGKAVIIGLDADVYYLVEKKAPTGYNLLDGCHSVTVDQNHNWIAYDDEGNLISSTSGVIIENNAGTELPSTGAMGTAMFITFGMFVVLGTGLLLVTKKRMSMIRE